MVRATCSGSAPVLLLFLVLRSTWSGIGAEAAVNIADVPDIASSTVAIQEGDSEEVKKLKQLFNDRDAQGFISYWKETGLSPNFVDVHGRGFVHWIVGANLLAFDVPIRALAPINVYFSANHEAAVDWDIKDVTGHTGLHYSVLYDKQALVQILLARGATVTPRNPEGKTGLHMAAELGLTATTNLLLQGSDLRAPAPQEVLYVADDVMGFTPLHYAARSDFHNVAEMLARFARDPEHYIVHQPAEYPNVSSPFHTAVTSGSVKVVEVFLDLIQSHVELIKGDSRGLLPLQIAASFGNDKIVKLLVDRFRRTDIRWVCFQDIHGRNALHYAARFGHVEVVRLILRRLDQAQKEECIYHAANNGWTPVHYAARYHYNQVLDFMLKISTSGVDLREENGLTALQLGAVGCGLSKDASVVKLLIRAQADVSVSNSYPPLETCQKRGCSSCVEAIKAAGSSENGVKYPPACVDPSGDSSPFVQSGDRTKTLSGTKNCGVPNADTGRQLCFFVEVVDYAGFDSPSQGTVLGLGVAIDEYLVSVPASMFVSVDGLFNKRTLSTNGEYAVKTIGQRGRIGRYVQASGPPTIHRSFTPQSIENDLAYLILAESISEFDDGVCFLCLPVDEVPLGCLSSNACFVISPDSGTVSSTPTAAAGLSSWSKFTPTVLSRDFCAVESARERIAPSDNHICVENPEQPLRCGNSSSVLICQTDSVVRLYGHQVFPNSADALAKCADGKVHGIFTSLQTAGARSFYQTAQPPSEDEGILFGGFG